MNLRKVRRRAILYLRISKDVRGDEEGVERQEYEGRAVADRRGWDIVAVIVDNDTSAKGHDTRAGWKRMFAMLRAGEADTVIGQDMTRVLRNGRDRVDMLELGKDLRITVALIKGNDMDLGTATGRYLADMLGAAALNEIELKSERQILRNLQQVRDGKAPIRRAFGYPGTDQRPGSRRKDQEGLEVRAIPVPPEVVLTEAAAIRMLFDGALAGDSVARLVRKMRATGLTTTRGTQWSRAGVRATLLNPRYAGLRAYHGEIHGEGNWPALVPQEQWQAVARKLTDPARTTNHRRTTARIHLLGGLARCGVCADGTTVKTTYGSSSEGRKYSCRKKRHLSRRADYIDDYVTEVMLSWAASPQAVHYIEQATGPDVTAVRKEVAALTSRLDELAEDYADGTLTREQLKAGSRRLQVRLAAAERIIESAMSVTALGPLVGSRAAEVWEGMNLDRRRQALDLAFTITLLPRGLDGRPISSRFDRSLVQIERR